jgi:hypothetical protein
MPICAAGPTTRSGCFSTAAATAEPQGKNAEKDKSMIRSMDRPRRGRAALGIAAASLVMVQLGPIGTAGAAAAGGEFRLAQAASSPNAATADQQMSEQLGDLQRNLKITPAQQPQFDTFAQAMRQNQESMDALMRRNPPGGPRTAVAELQAQAEAADAEAQGLRHMLPIFETLYASLSDEQKRTADQMFAGPPGGNQPAAR